ncbi:hypothetical protein M378DRAFT_172629 [Amanita muscaria Koide BX008]|uniref:Uncharacterized protein n=1 Tax=Amanita muscaria (strain Koide BX008) TaxID=946122 RepID=A0A0C2W606_AMAMK|nr:hypothetical protein M378DRAFT_172629 [Amanita muscaria Koide BX008]
MFAGSKVEKSLELRVESKQTSCTFRVVGDKNVGHGYPEAGNPEHKEATDDVGGLISFMCQTGPVDSMCRLVCVLLVARCCLENGLCLREMRK